MVIEPKTDTALHPSAIGHPGSGPVGHESPPASTPGFSPGYSQPATQAADFHAKYGDPHHATSMRVTKRNGTTETVDVNKIVRAVSRCCAGLSDVDAMRVATKTISGLYDGATTRELDQLSVQTAAA